MSDMPAPQMEQAPQPEPQPQPQAEAPVPQPAAVPLTPRVSPPPTEFVPGKPFVPAAAAAAFVPVQVRNSQLDFISLARSLATSRFASRLVR